MAKNDQLVSLLSVISKIFNRLVSNSLVDHLKKYGLFHDFHYGFSSSWSIADPLTVVFDRIARILNSSGITEAVALDTFKTFGRVWHANLFQKLKSYVTSS